VGSHNVEKYDRAIEPAKDLNKTGMQNPKGFQIEVPGFGP
jgi:hypothetical protein